MTEFKPQICSMCRRERTTGGVGSNPMDSYDYSPMQVITAQPLGWYSGDDGEVCPECMEATMPNRYRVEG